MTIVDGWVQGYLVTADGRDYFHAGLEEPRVAWLDDRGAVATAALPFYPADVTATPIADGLLLTSTGENNSLRTVLFSPTRAGARVTDAGVYALPLAASLGPIYSRGAAIAYLVRGSDPLAFRIVSPDGTEERVLDRGFEPHAGRLLADDRVVFLAHEDARALTRYALGRNGAIERVVLLPEYRTYFAGAILDDGTVVVVHGRDELDRAAISVFDASGVRRGDPLPISGERPYEFHLIEDAGRVRFFNRARDGALTVVELLPGRGPRSRALPFRLEEEDDWARAQVDGGAFVAIARRGRDAAVLFIGDDGSIAGPEDVPGTAHPLYKVELARSGARIALLVVPVTSEPEQRAVAIPLTSPLSRSPR